MTALGAHVRSVKPSRPPRSTRMRRLGGIAVTMALIVLGLGAGLWLGSPAGAATPPIRVDMGDGAGFVASTSATLLDVSALAPGGIASGSMNVLDNSDHDPGSATTDTITLLMTDVATAGGPTNPGAGVALKNALRFTVTVTGPAGSMPVHGALTTADLQTGIVLASGLARGDILAVAATASLPSSVGNEVQYGRFGFDLALDLTSAAPGGASDSVGSNGASAGSVDDAGAVGKQVNEGTPEVAAEHQELPPGEVENGSPDDHNVLVLGENKSSLPNTGVPVVSLIAVGGVVLLIGIGLLRASRHRNV